MSHLTIALAGNPNVGKSTVFNALTGLHQHTGNWAGKTVETARGTFQTNRHSCTLIDLPGTYSLSAHSEEERVARDYLLSEAADLIIVVCDATCLQRGLHLALQCLTLSEKVILCVNLMDEAEKMGIHPDLALLSNELSVPVIGCSARRKNGLLPLLNELDAYLPNPRAKLPQMSSEEIVHRAENLYNMAVPCSSQRENRKIDSLITGTFLGFCLMLLMLAVLLWITITGANALSDLLSMALTPIGVWLARVLQHTPVWLSGILLDGLWRVLSWVVAVMLPPMAIFFPLFTLLEDAGVLPRIAFVLDRPFQACNACGKQALTCCMGLGCNAAGVVGCRIIDSPRERLLAILTNCLTPCSGRFPMLAAMSAMLFVGQENTIKSAGIMTAFFALSLLLTFSVTKLLSATVLRGTPSAFTIEIPPFRRPQIGRVLIRSVLDRTVFVLGRAAVVAAPAGMLIWLIANISVGETSLLYCLANGLEPLGRLMGLDGVILLAFLFGLPANEIVLPLIVMGYLSSSVMPELSVVNDLYAVLSANHWTLETVLCVSVFTLAHWPCSTTTITIYKETHSLKWTLLGVILPTSIGITMCVILHSFFYIISS